VRRVVRSWVRRWGVRAVGLAITGVGLYVVTPSLVALLDAWPQLEGVRPRWFVLLAALEAASLASLWWLTRLALARPRHAAAAGRAAADHGRAGGHEDAGDRGKVSGGRHRQRRRRRTRTSVAWRDLAAAQLAGNAASRVMPGGAAAGGVVQGRMLVDSGQSLDRVTSGLVSSGLLSTGVLLTLPVLTIPALIIGPPPARQLQLGLVVSLLVAVVIVGLGVTVLTLPRLLAGVGIVIGGLAHPLVSKVTATGTALALARQRARVATAFRGHWWRAVAAAAGNRMLDYAALVAALVAVGAHARASEVLLAYVIAMALAMVPVTPGGLGFVETGLTGALVLAGVAADQAVVATLLYRLISFWVPIPVGALAWGAWSVHRRRTRVVPPVAGA
jgi:uncharacterized membrane protein YbhN (UPF0104 family)